MPALFFKSGSHLKTIRRILISTAMNRSKNKKLMTVSIIIAIILAMLDTAQYHLDSPWKSFFFLSKPTRVLEYINMIWGPGGM